MIAQLQTFILLLMFQDLENYTPLLMGLYQGVVGLHEAYQVSVAMEDIDKWVINAIPFNGYPGDSQ